MKKEKSESEPRDERSWMVQRRVTAIVHKCDRDDVDDEIIVTAVSASLCRGIMSGEIFISVPRTDAGTCVHQQ